MNKNQKGNFFSEEQKKVKGEIISIMIDTYFENLNKNIQLFDSQGISDLMSSVLATINSVILANTFNNLKISKKDHKQIIKTMFEIVQEEAKRRLKEIQEKEKNNDSNLDKTLPLYEVIDVDNHLFNIKLFSWDRFNMNNYASVIHFKKDEYNNFYIAFRCKKMFFNFLNRYKEGTEKGLLHEIQ